MPSSEEKDFSSRPYEDWLAFLFESEFPLDQYEIARLPKQPLVLIQYLTRLCHDLSALVAKYDWTTIDIGLWGVLCEPFWIPLNLLVNDKLPLEPRLECIRSMKVVYSDVVAKIPPEVEMENIFYMWWDIVCGALWNPFADKLNNFDAKVPLFEAVFETFKEILELGEERCAMCALHGLGHLPHPKSPELIQDYIDRHHKDIDEDFMKWLEECRDGTVM